MSVSDLCVLCPRKCNADRAVERGFCGGGIDVRVARAALHFWEEPCISGTRGSGTVFFCGCNLGCVFCQNKEISRGSFGKEISVVRLADIFSELEQFGAHNINLVTPTPYIRQIIKAIELCRGKMNIPFVYNTGGYELRSTIDMLNGYIDIYLTDIKYCSDEIAERYSNAADYFEIAVSAAEDMIKQTGRPIFDNEGLLKKGTIIRHLVLPSCRKDSIKIIEELDKRFDKKNFLLSLMSQFTPYDNYMDFPELNRRITSFEYNSVVERAIELGMTNGYMQERSSAAEEYIPPFDLTGI